MIKDTYRHSSTRGEYAANIVGYRKNKSNLNDIDGAPVSVSPLTDGYFCGVQQALRLRMGYVRIVSKRETSTLTARHYFSGGTILFLVGDYVRVSVCSPLHWFVRSVKLKVRRA